MDQFDCEPDIDRARTLLSDLLEQSALYKTSADFEAVLNFVVKLGNMAPRSMHARQRPAYEIRLNARHSPNVHFATIAQELAHPFLGHLGCDEYLRIPQRPRPPAEAASYLVCRRHGVDSRADAYLADYVANNPHGREHRPLCADARRRPRRSSEAALGIAPKMAFWRPACQLEALP